MLNNYSTFQNQYTYLVDCAGNVLCSNKTNIYDWGDVVTKGMEKELEDMNSTGIIRIILPAGSIMD